MPPAAGTGSPATDRPTPGASARRAWPAGRPGPALLTVLGLTALLACWPLATRLLGSELFPGPLATLQFLAREWERGQLWRQVAVTLGRVLASFGLALLIGVPLGYLLGVSRAAARLLAPTLGLLLTVPRILLLLVAYLVVGLNESALLIAITLILLPTVAVQLREGVRGLDPRYRELTQVFGLSRWARARAVLLPQLWPALLGTARVTLSLAWKMVVFAEVFGRTSGVGYMISFYYQGFEMRGILAYGLVMTLILSLLDWGLGGLGSRAHRWQGAGRPGPAA